MVETIIQWSSVAITAVSIIIAVYKTIKTKNKQKIVELAKIVQTIPDIINEAEEVLGSGTGKAKLTYALNKLNIKCLQAGIEFDEQGLTEEIENVLSTPQKKEEE